VFITGFMPAASFTSLLTVLELDLQTRGIDTTVGLWVTLLFYVSPNISTALYHV
jgi:hypothetical protein